MKRMIDEKLIELTKALLNEIKTGTFVAPKVHLQDIEDLILSDYGSLFPDLTNNGGKVVKVKEDEEGFEYGEVSGGTQLYKHHISLIDGASDYIELVDNNYAPVTLLTLMDRFVDSLRVYCDFEYSGSNGIKGFALNLLINIPDEEISFFMVNDNRQVVSDTLSSTLFEDDIAAL